MIPPDRIILLIQIPDRNELNCKAERPDFPVSFSVEISK